MEEWIKAGDFVRHDVIRFAEALWDRKGPKGRQKSYKVGAREVTAEVIDIYRDDEGVWVVLKIVRCMVLEDKSGGRRQHMIKDGEEIKRLRASLIKYGKPRRLPWSDESNRAMLADELSAPASRRKR